MFKKNLFVIIFTLLFMISCNKSNNSTYLTEDGVELPVLRVASMPSITCLATYYVEKNKLDEKNGFKMEVIMFDTGAPMNEALAADLWDVGAMGGAAVTGVANYNEMIIGEILESIDGQGIFVRPDSPIAQDKGYNKDFTNVLGSPNTVKGITVLAPVGTAQHFTILKWLDKIGLKPTDVNIVNMDSVQAYQALQSKRCDAVSLNVPTFFNAINDGMVQVANLADLGTRYVEMIVANSKSIESKKDLIQKYVDTILEASEAIKNDQEMAADLFMEFLKNNGMEVTREDCVADLKRANFLTKEDFKGRKIGNFAVELGKFYIEQGQLDASAQEKFDNNIIDTFIKAYQ